MDCLIDASIRDIAKAPAEAFTNALTYDYRVILI